MDRPSKKRLCFQGTPIDELSREELVKAIELLYKGLESAREAHNRTLNMWSLCREKR